MNRECAVPTCSGKGRHEIDDEHGLCLRHALAWDDAEDERIGRLTDYHAAHPDGTDDDAWAEMVSEWLGAQQ